MPWPHTSPADAARTSTSARLKQMSWALGVLCGVAVAVALAAVVPLLAGPGLDERARTQLFIVLFPSALAFGALISLVLVQRRARKLAADTLRRTARELQRGAWRQAVERMRETPPAEPSAFGDLANQVEGVMGEQERRWQARVELSQEWYWESDERHRLSSLSAEAPMVKPADRALGDVLGRRHDELGFVHPPIGGWAAFNQMLDRQESFRELEFEVDGLGGRARGWMSLSGRPRYHRDGRFSGYEGVGHDITVHKESFRRLQASEQRYAVLAGLSADWYWITDAEHRFMQPNEEQRRRLGQLAEVAEGRTRWELYPQALTEAQWRAHRADMDAGRPFHALEFQIVRNDGTALWVSVSGAPRFDENGRFLGYHGVGRDITLRKKAEQMLVQHNRQLQSAVAARTRELEFANRDLEAFARHLAHELRTPIGHVQGLAELLRRRLAEHGGSEVNELLDLQVRATQEMLTTLEALLALARSSSEAIERAPVDLSRLAEEVINTLPPVERVAPVRWQIEPGLTAWASESQMRIVLANLLGNAAKFTRRTPDAVVALCSVLGPNGQLVFQVRDNGAGFDAARASRLFQPFHRLHDDHEFQGTGIGLTIVQRIVQRHGGAIRAIGDLGQGACFEFSLGSREAANSTIAGTLPDVSQPQPLDSTVAPSREIAA
ncbi:MAG: PAS domain S-box protein [Burkholderiaceae bacterium]|jgi:PAS domain S-box-containing protein|nr:PAS domain S-box protein [Burkholderiaceae bacterium]